MGVTTLDKKPMGFGEVTKLTSSQAPSKTYPFRWYSSISSTHELPLGLGHCGSCFTIHTLTGHLGWSVHGEPTVFLNMLPAILSYSAVSQQNPTFPEFPLLIWDKSSVRSGQTHFLPLWLCHRLFAWLHTSQGKDLLSVPPRDCCLVAKCDRAICQLRRDKFIMLENLLLEGQTPVHWNPAWILIEYNTRYIFYLCFCLSWIHLQACINLLLNGP